MQQSNADEYQHEFVNEAVRYSKSPRSQERCAQEKQKPKEAYELVKEKDPLENEVVNAVQQNQHQDNAAELYFHLNGVQVKASSAKVTIRLRALIQLGG